MATRAAVYTRISDDKEGREHGVRRQEQDCRALCEREGWEVAAVFRENDVSASTNSRAPRPHYADMIRRAELGEFDVLVAYTTSRLTRRPLEMNNLLELKRSHGVRIATVAGRVDLDAADGVLMARVLSDFDAAEAERTAERVKRAADQRAADGRWHGGPAPYGYRIEDKMPVVNEPEAKQVREAVSRILAGDALNAIVTDWNRRGVTTRTGSHWRQSNLRAILMNPTMVGKTRAGVKGWEAIIDQRDYDRMQRVFGDPTRKTTHSPGVRSSKYSMGGGVTVCGVCGKKLINHTKRGRGALACLARVNGPHENHPPHPDTGLDQFRVVVDHDRLEEHVFTVLVDSITSNPRWAQRMSEPDPKVDARITVLERDRDDVVEKQRRLHDLYIDGAVDAEYHRTSLARLRQEHETIQHEIESLLGRPLLSRAIKDGLDWRSWSSDRRRNFLKVAGIRVVVGLWPEGEPKTLPRQRGESDESLSARRDEHLRRIIAERVSIEVA